MKRIYMDNAATTRITAPVLEAMMPCLTEVYGNPSSAHSFGRDARKLMDRARAQAAAALGAKPGEIYFTSGGTESDNWAVRGTAYALRDRGRHIITSAIEHHAILRTCEQLEREGFHVTYLPVNADGFVNPEDVEAALTPETTLVSVMAANNEIGTIQPVEKIGAIAKAHGVRFHTDAVQAAGAIPVDVNAMNADLLSLSGHKLHAPKGVGILYARGGVGLYPLMTGGEQERTRRPGTENLASIAGLGRALELAVSDLPARAARVSALRDRMIDGLTREIPDIRLNGSRENRLPGNINISVKRVEGESMLLNLDIRGIAASSGSACASGSLEPSHVLLALGLDPEDARGSLRFSLGDDNTEEEVDRVVFELKAIVERLRALSAID